MKTKFKAWDTIQKKWVSEDIVIDCNGVISISNLDSDTQQVEDLEIKWYTYIKDKNKQEIFDGCILKQKMLAMTIFWEVYYDDEEQKWFCKDVNKKIGNQSLHYTATRSAFVEIVGHIFEKLDEEIKGKENV